MVQPNAVAPDSQTVAHVIHINELLASLERIVAYNPPVHTCSTGWKFRGIYSGPTSIAYLFYRLSQLLPDLSFKSQPFEDWAIDYLDLGQSFLSKDEAVLLEDNSCGVTNEYLCQLVLRAALFRDQSLAEKLFLLLIKLSRISTISNNWYSGRAGSLYLLRMVWHGFRESSTIKQRLSTTASQVISNILSADDSAWDFEGQTNIGACYGQIGIITQIILTLPILNSAADTSAIDTRLRAVLTCLQDQYTSLSLDSASGICNGPAGVLTSLKSIRSQHSFHTSCSQTLQNAITAALELTQRYVEKHSWSKPTTNKNTSNLSHGTPGTLLALLATTTNNNIHDSKFHQLENLIRSTAIENNETYMAEAGRSDEFSGLWTGEGGRAWVWAVLEVRRKRKQEERRERREEEERGVLGGGLGVIGYNDL